MGYDCDDPEVIIDPPAYPDDDCCEGKQDKLTAGSGIKIEKVGNDTVISSTGGGGGTEYQAGDHIVIEDDVISADLSDYYDKTETDAHLADKADADSVYSKQDTDDLLDAKADSSNVYTKSETNDLIAAIDTFEAVIVQSLPQTGEPKTIYLVPKTGGGYTEYLYISNAWEEIGDTDIDLTDYYTKSETNNLLSAKADASSVYTKSESDALLNAKQDTLVSGTNIKTVNNESLLGSGNVNIPVPTNVSQLNNDAGYITSSDLPTIDQNYNASSQNPQSGTAVAQAVATKADASNVYTKSEADALLSNKANLSDIPDLSDYFRVAGGTSEMKNVNAGDKATYEINLNVPSGYTFVAYRQLSIGEGTDGYNADDCVVRFFSSTGGGTKAQVSIKNIGQSQARVNVTVTCLLLKSF